MQNFITAQEFKDQYNDGMQMENGHAWETEEFWQIAADIHNKFEEYFTIGNSYYFAKEQIINSGTDVAKFLASNVGDYSVFAID